MTHRDRVSGQSLRGRRKTKEARKKQKTGIQRNNTTEKKGSMSTRGQKTFEKVAAFDERRTSTLDTPDRAFLETVTL